MLSLDGNFSRMTKDGLRKVTKKEKKVEESHRSRWEVSARAGTETDLISESSGIVTPIKLQSSDYKSSSGSN